MMKGVYYTLYLLMLNLIWLAGLLLTFASGHQITFANSSVRQVTLIAGVSLLDSLFLISYTRSGNGVLKIISLLFQFIVAACIIYFLWELLSDGFFIGQIPVYLLLMFLVFFWVKVTRHLFR